MDIRLIAMEAGMDESDDEVFTAKFHQLRTFAELVIEDWKGEHRPHDLVSRIESAGMTIDADEGLIIASGTLKQVADLCAGV